MSCAVTTARSALSNAFKHALTLPTLDRATCIELHLFPYPPLQKPRHHTRLSPFAFPPLPQRDSWLPKLESFNSYFCTE